MKTCFLMTGLSGAGKTSIFLELIKNGVNIEKVITSTSRPIRNKEVNGVDYYFYTREQMLKMKENDEFYEIADEIYNAKNIYGSEKKEVERIENSGKNLLFVCDVQGRESLLKINPEIKTVFILPDSFEHLKSRIEDRDKITEEQRNGLTEQELVKLEQDKKREIQARLETAEKELKDVEKCDYCIVNKEGKLDDAVNEFEKIVKMNTGEGSDEIQQELLKCKPSDENIQALIQELKIGIENFKQENQKEIDNEMKMK